MVHELGHLLSRCGRGKGKRGDVGDAGGWRRGVRDPFETIMTLDVVGEGCRVSLGGREGRISCEVIYDEA